MNVLFAIKKDLYSALEPMGILYLSGILKKNNHNVFLSDSSFKNIAKCVKEKKIGLFAISCMNTDYKYYLALSQRFKKSFPKIPIIWGGPTPTYNPEIIKEKGIDIICRGEGELALLELVNRLDNKKSIKRIPNLWVKSKQSSSLKKLIIYKNNMGYLVSNLDQLPFPDRSLTKSFPQFKYAPIKFVVASRGCPFNCSFCFNSKFHHLYRGKGKVVRARSVDNVIEELGELKINYHARFIYFPDDVFPFEKKWIAEFTKKYKQKINLPFTMVTSVAFINGSFVKNLKKAGCVSMHLAIECGNEKIRKEVLNKSISNEQILKACKIVKSYGISICAYNMVGIPFSGLDNEIETLDLNIKAQIDVPYVFFCLPFLETQLGRMAQKARLISKETEFLSWFERMPIQVENREKIEKFAQLFTIVVLFPCLRRYLRILLILPIPKSVLKLLKDILNGYSLKKKILPVKVSYQEFLVTFFYFISKRFTK